MGGRTANHAFCSPALIVPWRPQVAAVRLTRQNSTIAVTSNTFPAICRLCCCDLSETCSYTPYDGRTVIVILAAKSNVFTVSGLTKRKAWSEWVPENIAVIRPEIKHCHCIIIFSLLSGPATGNSTIHTLEKLMLMFGAAFCVMLHNNFINKYIAFMSRGIYVS